MEEMWSPVWKKVTCKDCGREFVFTPNDDYYGSSTPTDGVCESCLFKAAGIAPNTPVIVVLPIEISKN